MRGKPLVSVITPFLDTPVEFLREAVGSVLDQTYRNFELLLVDDGSTRPDVLDTAREYAQRRPDRIRYLQHPGGENRGSSATRRLGCDEARGSLIAFLDSDDLWVPHKLEEQVRILEEHPEAGMLYGSTRYWSSWAGEELGATDYEPPLRLPTGVVHAPPKLLALFVGGRVAIPCTCSVIVRRAVVEECEGFEAGYDNMYDDQMFYAKVLLHTGVYVSDRCWDLYRQHGRSMTSLARERGELHRHRTKYLDWLAAYLREQGVEDPDLWRAVRREQWLWRRPDWLPAGASPGFRWLKKWVLRAESAVRRR
jgi:glycosyltransferase involved in cell wall biosynthesis